MVISVLLWILAELLPEAETHLFEPLSGVCAYVHDQPSLLPSVRLSEGTLLQRLCSDDAAKLA